MWLHDSSHRRLGDGIQPAWSPAGRHIAVVTADLAGAQVVEVESGRVLEVDVDAKRVMDVAWAPDGRFLVVAANRGKSLDLMVVPFDDPRSAVRARGWASVKKTQGGPR